MSKILDILSLRYQLMSSNRSGIQVQLENTSMIFLLSVINYINSVH